MSDSVKPNRWIRFVFLNPEIWAWRCHTTKLGEMFGNEWVFLRRNIVFLGRPTFSVSCTQRRVSGWEFRQKCLEKWTSVLVTVDQWFPKFQGGAERLGGIRVAVNGWRGGISLKLGICGIICSLVAHCRSLRPMAPKVGRKGALGAVNK